MADELADRRRPQPADGPPAIEFSADPTDPRITFRDQAALDDYIRGAAAEAWDAGRFAERTFAKQVAEYHHWSHIGSGQPVDPPNPHRPPVVT